MIDQSDLNEAARTAKQLVIDGDTVDVAVARAAKEWAVPAAAVAARAEKMFFGSLSQFAGVVVTKRNFVEEARQIAVAESLNWRNFDPALTGALIALNDGTKMVYVCGDSQKAVTIKIETGHRWQSTGRYARQALEQAQAYVRQSQKAA